MRIETERLVIRTLEPRDRDAWISMFNDPEVSRYTPSDDTVATPELYQSVLERRLSQERELGYAMWAVETKETGAWIGQCGLYRYRAEGKEPEIEIAYHYLPEQWNKGYGTEAAVAVLTYGFGAVGLDRVIALVAQENVGSWRIAERAGMRFEGLATYYNMPDLKKYVAERAWWRPPEQVR
jgi:RimJ/RimL family protein N-acetyltransferase